MSQHDYAIANDTGANFRSDLNSALSAIVSNNSGATEPSTMFAYQLWADTTTGLLKIRNAANSAWVTVGTLASTNLGLLSLAGGTLTGALLSAVGSVGAPGVAFSGDADTGFYWISANKFAAVVNGAAVMTFDASTYTQINGTSAVLLPIGTTLQRPTGTAGLIRYNSDTSSFEGYASGAWGSLAGGAPVAITWVTKTSGYTITSSDVGVIANSATGFTLTLPSATSNPGKIFYLKSIGAGAITIARAGSDLIDGESSQTLSAYSGIILISDGGTNWYAF